MGYGKQQKGKRRWQEVNCSRDRAAKRRKRLGGRVAHPTLSVFGVLTLKYVELRFNVCIKSEGNQQD